jgi:hypothetical protein
VPIASKFACGNSYGSVRQWVAVGVTDIPRRLQLAICFARLQSRRLRAATDAEMLPEAKPRTVGEQFVMPLICGREVSGAQWPGIGNGKEAFQALNFDNGLLGVQRAVYPTTGRNT